MAPKSKAKGKAPTATHPLDASGILQAAKDGEWAAFDKILGADKKLTFEDINSLPPGRSFGLVHQIAYHSALKPLERLLARHPRVDLKLRTKHQGKTQVGRGGTFTHAGFVALYIK
jgi:hypothetical protein